MAPLPTSDVWEVVSVETELNPFFEQMVSKQLEGEAQVPANLNQHEAAIHPCSWSLQILLPMLKAVETKQDENFTDILNVVGEFGTFQRRLVALTFIPNLLLAFFMFADIFVFAAQKPCCNTSWILAVGPNPSEAEQLNVTLPREPNGSFQMCLRYLPVTWDLDSIIQFGLNDTQSCQNGWIYPDSEKRSLIDKVCLVLSCV